MNDMTTPVTDRLVQDLRTLVADTEELLKATAAETGERMVELRKRIEGNLRIARARLADAEKVLVEKSKAAVRATDRYVHENPWTVAGIAAGVGLLLGLLISRRD